MMKKLYLVYGTYVESDYCLNPTVMTSIYGLFTTHKKAREIVKNLKASMTKKELESEELKIKAILPDELTEDYIFMIETAE